MHDLLRYGIETVLIDDYNQIPEILKEVKKISKCNNIFISGAAQEYGAAWEKTAPIFIKKLVSNIYKKNYKIITGHGRGVGSYVISSVIEECQLNVNALEKHLIIKAFPYEDKERSDYEQLIKDYREGIFKYAGIAIFMFGNKVSDGDIIRADGVYKEYEMAKQCGACIIPIGSTGYVAKEIWNEVSLKLDDFPYLKGQEKVLQDCTDPDKVVNAIISILDTIAMDY